jgi:hypothetical protein
MREAARPLVRDVETRLEVDVLASHVDVFVAVDALLQLRAVIAVHEAEPKPVEQPVNPKLVSGNPHEANLSVVESLAMDTHDPALWK